jgi:hypothetical protein
VPEASLEMPGTLLLGTALGVLSRAVLLFADGCGVVLVGCAGVVTPLAVCSPGSGVFVGSIALPVTNLYWSARRRLVIGTSRLSVASCWELRNV